MGMILLTTSQQTRAVADWVAMPRSLPENTVDAWTSIKLAAIRASWIWLPTTNQGASWTGGHPGDISSVLGKRLVLIENKGVEDGTAIDFGDNASDQLDYLARVEEEGIRAVAPTDPRLLGWVFYGLPLLGGFVSGSQWKDLPKRHYLICPHLAKTLGTSLRSVPLAVVDRVHHDIVVHYCGSKQTIWRVRPFDAFRRLTLSSLAISCRAGVVGLPLATTSKTLLTQLKALVIAAAAASDQDVTPGDDLFDLLHLLANVVKRGTQNTVLCLLD
jgi:hypothetical protein